MCVRVYMCVCVCVSLSVCVCARARVCVRARGLVRNSRGLVQMSTQTLQNTTFQPCQQCTSTSPTPKPCTRKRNEDLIQALPTHVGERLDGVVERVDGVTAAVRRKRLTVATAAAALVSWREAWRLRRVVVEWWRSSKSTRLRREHGSRLLGKLTFPGSQSHQKRTTVVECNTHALFASSHRYI